MKKNNLLVLLVLSMLSMTLFWCANDDGWENTATNNDPNAGIEADVIQDWDLDWAEDEFADEPEIDIEPVIEEAVDASAWNNNSAGSVNTAVAPNNNIANWVDVEESVVKQFQDKQAEIQGLVQWLMEQNPEMKVVQEKIAKMIQEWNVEWEEFAKLQTEFEWFFTQEVKTLDSEIRSLYDEITNSQQANLTSHPKFNEYREKWEKLQTMYKELMDSNLQMKEISLQLEKLAWEWKVDSEEFKTLQTQFESFLTTDMRDLESEVKTLYETITQQQ